MLSLLLIKLAVSSSPALCWVFFALRHISKFEENLVKLNPKHYFNS